MPTVFVFMEHRLTHTTDLKVFYHKFPLENPSQLFTPLHAAFCSVPPTTTGYACSQSMPALCMVALTVPADNLGCRRFHRVCGTIDCRPKICKEKEEAQKMLLNSKSVLLCKLCETGGNLLHRRVLWDRVRYLQVSQSGKCEGVLRDAGDLVLGQRECVQMLQRGGKHVRTQLLQAILVEVTRERERETGR